MLLRKYTHRRKLNETNTKFVVFRDVMPYNLVIMSQRFRENRFLALQDTKLKTSRKLLQNVMALTSLAFRCGSRVLDLQNHSYFDSRNVKLAVPQGFSFYDAA